MQGKRQTLISRINTKKTNLNAEDKRGQDEDEKEKKKAVVKSKERQKKKERSKRQDLRLTIDY